MEAFPKIEHILEQTNFSTFQTEIAEMSERNRMKLENEEYKALSEFRIKLLGFYQDNKKVIHDEYTAEVEKLRKQVYQMLKDYKDQILTIRSKHLKTDVPDEELGIQLKALPKRRYRQGATLRERYIAGDDFIRDVERLPRKYQEKIDREIELLYSRDYWVFYLVLPVKNSIFQYM